MKVRTESRREAIIDEATRLFLELGYERATMGELTRRLGGSKATLYGYFASKQELFVAVVETLGASHLMEAAAELENMAPGDLREGLTRFARRMLALLVRDEALAMQRMIIGESSRSEVGDILIELGPQRTLGALVRAFRGAMARGELPAGPAEVLAQQLIALVQAEVALRVFMRQPPPVPEDEREAMARRAVRVFLAGCSALGTQDGD